MEDLQFGLEFCHWLRLVLLADQHHPPSDILPHQLLIRLGRFHIETGQISSNRILTRVPRDMNRLNLHTLKILQLVRPQQTHIIQPSNATLDNPRQDKPNPINNEAFVNFELKGLQFELFDCRDFYVQFRDEVDQDIEALFADA